MTIGFEFAVAAGLIHFCNLETVTVNSVVIDHNDSGSRSRGTIDILLTSF